MSLDPETEREVEMALELLSVELGNIAEEVAGLACGPPQPPATYADLAQTFERASSDIAVLARAMAIFARKGDYAPFS